MLALAVGEVFLGDVGWELAVVGVGGELLVVFHCAIERRSGEVGEHGCGCVGGCGLGVGENVDGGGVVGWVLLLLSEGVEEDVCGCSSG